MEYISKFHCLLRRNKDGISIAMIKSRETKKKRTITGNWLHLQVTPTACSLQTSSGFRPVISNHI